MRSNSATITTPKFAARDTVSVSWGYFILTLACACALAAGFFFAARQHFNTMELGMKNSNLRKQVEDLQTEKRRLLLVREVSLSPAEVKRAAKNLGFRDRGEVATAADARGVSETLAPAVRTASAGAALVKPIRTSYVDASAKIRSTDKSVKKIVMQTAKIAGVEARLVASTR